MYFFFFFFLFYLSSSSSVWRDIFYSRYIQASVGWNVPESYVTHILRVQSHQLSCMYSWLATIFIISQQSPRTIPEHWDFPHISQPVKPSTPKCPRLSWSAAATGSRQPAAASTRPGRVRSGHAQPQPVTPTTDHPSAFRIKQRAARDMHPGVHSSSWCTGRSGSSSSKITVLISMYWQSAGVLIVPCVRPPDRKRRMLTPLAWWQNGDLCTAVAPLADWAIWRKR